MHDGDTRRNVLLALLGSALLLAAGSLPPPERGRAWLSTPDSLVWTQSPALPEGVLSALLVGDPAKAGETVVLRLKFPPRFVMPPHTHPHAEVVTVVSGRIGTADGEKVRAGGELLGPGALWSYPARRPHYAWTGDGEAVVQVQFTGPAGIEYLNPADDPRRH